MALPYITPPHIRGLPIQPYGLLLLLALAGGALTTWRLARRFAIPGTDLAVLVPIAIAAALIGAHVFDVIGYQWARAADDAGLWLRLIDGVSLFGALLGVTLATVIIAQLRRLDLPLVADIAAVACLVATTIGRVGCALVHDHPGAPTDSPLGVDFPARALRWTRIDVGTAETVRIHDVGLEELLVLVPMTAAAIMLVRLRLRAGMVAVIVAIGYACARFGLDFLRLPATEPTHAGLTLGQWSSIAMATMAAILVGRVARVGHVAPLAAELAGQPGGRRRAPLPPATRM